MPKLPFLISATLLAAFYVLSGGDHFQPAHVVLSKAISETEAQASPVASPADDTQARAGDSIATATSHHAKFETDLPEGRLARGLPNSLRGLTLTSLDPQPLATAGAEDDAAIETTLKTALSGRQDLTRTAVLER